MPDTPTIDFGGRFYVYALIDPTTSTPFYIGKGGFDRAYQHFKAVKPDDAETEEESDSVSAKKTKERNPVAGASTTQIWNAEGLNDLESTTRSGPDETAKIRKIRQLLESGITRDAIPRVLARNLSSEAAHAIESLLIKGVYGHAALTNAAAGHHEERFRAANEWDHLPGFDLAATQAGDLLPDNGNHACGAHYTYVLRDPSTDVIFYVGKGTAGRLCDHFRNALRLRGAKAEQPKDLEERRMLSHLKSVMDSGHKPVQIGRIIARVHSEALAFAIESFYMKFVTGFAHVMNVQSGHRSGWFRAQSDWKVRDGFDLPINIRGGLSRMKLDGYLGEGLDYELRKVVDRTELKSLVLDWKGPALVGAGELGYYCHIQDVSKAVRLRIQIRSARRFQIVLVGGEYSDRDNKPPPPGWEWLRHNFSRFGLYPLRRPSGDMFFPDCWFGARKVTDDPNEALQRALQMIGLAQALQSAKHPDELLPFQEILQGLPYTH